MVPAPANPQPACPAISIASGLSRFYQEEFGELNSRSSVGRADDEMAQWSWLRSNGFFVYCEGKDRSVSGQQYSSNFASARRRPIMRA